MKTNELSKIFSAGIFKENPIFVLFLSLCPALGVTTSVENAIGMGVGILLVMTMSSVVVSLIRKVIMNEVRLPVFIVIIASLTTVLQMFMQAFTIDLYNAMKVFIPLIAVNCIIMGRAESFASKNGIFKSILDALGMGIGLTMSLILIGFFRELLGTGAISGFQIIPVEFTIPLFTTSVGSFLTFGFLAGLIAVYSNHKKDIKDAMEKAAAAAKKAELEQQKSEVAQ